MSLFDMLLYFTFSELFRDFQNNIVLLLLTVFAGLFENFKTP